VIEGEEFTSSERCCDSRGSGSATIVSSSLTTIGVAPHIGSSGGGASAALIIPELQCIEPSAQHDMTAEAPTVRASVSVASTTTIASTSDVARWTKS